MSRSNNHYVLLTGSKNNAGDFLIKYRAKQLLQDLRPDRALIDYNAWEPLNKKKLDAVNNSKALILMGGPSLRYDMYPGVYKLTNRLSELNVPLIAMGVGWKGVGGADWTNTHSYNLSKDTVELLDLVSKSGYLSSVRDYYTLNVLNSRGYDNYLMTGCPAYYSLDTLREVGAQSKSLTKVAFSLGVSFINSLAMERQMKSLIERVQKVFEGKRFCVAFHHSLEPDKYLATHGASSKHNNKHREFADWLRTKNIDFVDISGSAENLIDFYSSADIHIGYRVHAHIFMCSMNKPSVLVAEDGRGKGVYSVVGGYVFDGVERFSNSFYSKVLTRLRKNHDRYTASRYLEDDVELALRTLLSGHDARYLNTMSSLRNNYEVMRKFILQLP